MLLDNVSIFLDNDQREQEWNISRKELLELVEAGILVEDDIKQVTAAKFNPVSSKTFNIVVVVTKLQGPCLLKGLGP